MHLHDAISCYEPDVVSSWWPYHKETTEVHDTYLFTKKRGQKAHLEHTNLQYKLLDWK